MEKPHKRLRAWQLELAKRLEFVDEKTWKELDNKLLEEEKVLSELIRSRKELSK